MVKKTKDIAPKPKSQGGKVAPVEKKTKKPKASPKPAEKPAVVPVNQKKIKKKPKKATETPAPAPVVVNPEKKKKVAVEKKQKKQKKVKTEEIVEKQENEELQENEKIGNYNAYITEKMARLEEIKEKVKVKVQLDRKVIMKAVKALIEFNERTKNQKNILDTNEGFVYVEIAFNKLPEHYSVRPVQM